MTTKGGKGFNKNFKGFPKGAADKDAPKQAKQHENSTLKTTMKLGFVDIKEIPEAVLAQARTFLEKWGLKSEEYSLIGVLSRSIEPIEFSPLVILSGQTEVVVLREVILSDTIIHFSQMNIPKCIPSEIYRTNGNLALLKRVFVSNTLGDVFRMSGGFSLERLVNLLYSAIDSLRVLHENGIVHGNLTEWNFSAGMENPGYLIDVGIYADGRSFAEDLAALASIMDIALSKVRVKKEELADKRKLQGIVAPLLNSLSEEDDARRPTLDVALGLFKDLVGLVLEDALPTDIVTSATEVESDPIENLNLISEVSREIPEDQVVISKFNNRKIAPPEIQEAYQATGDHETKNSSYETTKEVGKSGLFKYLVYIVLIALVCFLSFKVFNKVKSLPVFGNSTGLYDGKLMGLEELQLSWNSGVPSKMQEVARQAIYQSSLRELAEEVIITPILSDQGSSRYIDASLIRVAYAKEWEPQLNTHDRRFILALALREVLKNEFPTDVPLLSELHPAILLSVLSGTESKVPAILDSVPAQILEGLPEPFGVAFQILLSRDNNLKASSAEVISLAHLGTRGANNAVTVSRFLEEDFERRLSSLAVMFSANSDESLKILDIILNHPNVAIENPATAWAKKVDLLSWDGIEASDKLFLIAGVALRPDKVLSVGQIARMFLNPSPRVRKYAVGLSIHQIPFKHKGALEVLTLVQNVPDILSADQLTLLAQILEDPDRTVSTHMKVVQSFISSEPPIDIVKTLLLANWDSKVESIIDGSLSAYLSERGWIPDANELDILVKHHDKVARMYAYQRIFLLDDKAKAANLLKRAFVSEGSKEFKEQLKIMIDQLAGVSK